MTNTLVVQFAKIDLPEFTDIAPFYATTWQQIGQDENSYTYRAGFDSEKDAEEFAGLMAHTNRNTPGYVTVREEPDHDRLDHRSAAGRLPAPA